ncbi:hypothetical protein SS05631_c13770 [Sinorhizobium sp. CCBAU 05631]|nr:hypothetical protein SS05631_c13770 [Sinorhizobium sp. CCBAU 05631]
MWLLAFPRQLAVKRRLVGKHRAAKIGDTFEEITHVRILFLAGRRTGRNVSRPAGCRSDLFAGAKRTAKRVQCNQPLLDHDQQHVRRAHASPPTGEFQVLASVRSRSWAAALWGLLRTGWTIFRGTVTSCC